jgi:hypothetical protein
MIAEGRVGNLLRCGGSDGGVEVSFVCVQSGCEAYAMMCGNNRC